MVSKKAIEDFYSFRKLAIVGVSRSGKKFGNSATKELTKRGYIVYPVNPNADNVDGNKCYRNLNNLPEKVEGAVIIVQPHESGKVVREAKAAGINNIWLQQGSQSEDAINYCNNNGMNVVYGECILMFSEPVGGFHKFHRTINKVLRELPK